MLLICDIGNTNIVYSLLKDQKPIGTARIDTDLMASKEVLTKELMGFLESSNVHFTDVEGAVISSVVRPLTHKLRVAIEGIIGKTAVVIAHDLDLGFSFHIQHPETVGPDRICNAKAVYHYYGGPAIVVDLGTATNIEVVDGEGNFLGGAILPGAKTSADALYEKAEMLPRVPFEVPGTAIGKDTVHAIQSGIMYGAMGQVDFLIHKIKQELGEEAKVVATGGLSTILCSHLSSVDVIDETLTLKGMELLYHRNKGENKNG